METIITVSCTRDKWCLALQSHTLEKFVDEPCTHIVVVEDNETSKHEWGSMLFPIYKKHKLILVTEDLFPEIYPKEKLDGWHNQQVIKFLVHKLVDKERYLILDSKNIFIKPTKLQKFKNEGCGSTLSIDDNWMNYWRPWMNFVSNKINKPIPQIVWYPNTPFIVRTEIIKEIFQTCNYEELVVTAARSSIPVSEFLLYVFFSKPDYHERFSYGGGYHPGNGVDATIHQFKNVPTYTLGRQNLQNEYERKVIEDSLLYLGLDKELVHNATHKTTM